MKSIICKKDIKNEIKNNPVFVSAHLLRESIYNLIKKDYPDFSRGCYIDKNEVERYRKMHLESLINKEDKEDHKLNENVIDSILNKNTLSDNIEDDLDKDLSIGQKIADKVAKFGGSWAFINSFAVFLFLWMTVNVWVLTSHPFDPYPFILLILFLSTLAAIQAPVIMMS